MIFDRSIKGALWRLSPALFHASIKKFAGQIFSISVFHTNSPIALDEKKLQQAIAAQDVTDVPAAFVADPFLIRTEKGWFMFFEVFNLISGQGEIGVAKRSEGVSWKYQGIVMAQDHHLAYPLVFEWNEDFYMLPDNNSQQVILYRAKEFPSEWEPVSVVLSNGSFSDSTMFEHDGSWWMFTCSKHLEDKGYTLHLYYADSPVADWIEHPLSPLIEEDDRHARPAGRVLKDKTDLYRFAQNCEISYGKEVCAFRILELTRTSYVEETLETNPIMGPGSHDWNVGGMHHIDAVSIEENLWIAACDGWCQ